MSQYPSVPPPGPYAPQNQNAAGAGAQQSQHYPSQSSPYQQSTPGYQPKSSAGFGQMFNQAVTTGKPMLNKLGKTISSKLGSKQSAPSTPQHLQSYQNYQEHYQQPNPNQQFTPQQSQQQWQPAQQSPQTNTYSAPQQQQQQQQQQQNPYLQFNHTQTSGIVGQGNYAAQQGTPVQNIHAPPPPPNNEKYDHSQYPQGQNIGVQQQSQPQPQPAQGQFQQGQYNQSPPQGNYQEGHFGGQQTGVVGVQPTATGTPVSPQTTSPPTFHDQAAFGVVPNQPQQHQPNPNQQQWGAPMPNYSSKPSPGPQAAQPAQSYSTTSPPPVQPTQGYGISPAVSPPPQLDQQQHQQWAPLSPGATQAHVPPSVSPPPPQSAGSPPQQPQPPAVPTQNAPTQPAPTEFIAELPADMGNMSIMENARPQGAPANPPQSASPYQAYTPPPAASQSQSPRPGFTVPRRAVSMSSLPLADPWRFADPVTETPTREFYILADLLFEAMDRRFEPQNTGIIEASKILECWKVQQELADEVAQIFTFNSFEAFAKLWALEGVPHIMVPCQPSLMPIWNYRQQSHSQEMKIAAEAPPAHVPYPTYMPALNRAGWYKHFFMDMLHEPENLEKMLQALCADTYKPGVLNQPDLRKRDTAEAPALTGRAAAIRTATVPRVCQEMASAIQGSVARGAPTETAPAHAAAEAAATAEQEAALKMQSLKMQQQMNDMMNKQMAQGALSMSMAAGNMYRPNYGSLV